jgi:hypothetical protein
VEQDFRDNIGAWVEANGIAIQALVQMGVPVRVLRSAGIRVANVRHVSGGGGRVSIEKVLSQLPAGTWTVGDLCARTGASRGTVSAAVRQGLEAGTIVSTAETQRTGGRGAPSKVYATA